MKGIIRQPAFLRSALGAALAVLCGLALWASSPGDPWVNASYDCLFRFGSHSVTNRVVLILMDNAAFAQFHQIRGQPWDRALHAQLLNRLADDGCPLVAMDSFFHDLRDTNTDAALAAAMRRQCNLVLMAQPSDVNYPGLAGTAPSLPAPLLLAAARTNWGVAWLNPDPDGIVRRHWPLFSPGPYPSLPWTVARLAGAKLPAKPQERWLRYYGETGPWTRMSYGYALTQPKGYFHDCIVFIGTEPKTSLPDRDTDKFSTPYTTVSNEASGGVEILITSFLNLINHDWLERPAAWVECLTLLLAGILSGVFLALLKSGRAVLAAAVAFVAVALGGILLGQFTSVWFPWLVIAGGQIPCALASVLVFQTVLAVPNRLAKKPKSSPPPPPTPGYELIHPPFGEGSYGKVWLARTKDKQWRALKIVYRENFGANAGPYDREYDGISRYLRVSGQHPGLLRVDFVSEKKPTYFYYVMELGDATAPRTGSRSRPLTNPATSSATAPRRTRSACPCASASASVWPWPKRWITSIRTD